MNQQIAHASDQFQIRHHRGNSASAFLPAGRMSAMFWPDGTSCWQVNTYLFAMRRRGLATSTTNTYCAELAQFIRYAAATSTRLDEVTDDDLREFAVWLLENSSASQRHRNRILLRVLDLLWWLQARTCSLRPLVGLEGEGALVTVGRKFGQGSKKAYQTWTHPALGAPDVPTEVHPLSRLLIDKLLSAVKTNARRSFTRARNLTMLKLLADSGIRRQELVWITTDAIGKAASNGGRLTVRTAKRRGNPLREVPISASTVSALVTYVEVQRGVRIGRLKKRSKGFVDEGWAFCTYQGSRMAEASVTQLMTDLRNAAGIDERATAHMFRHRWITLQVLARLKAFSGVGPYSLELVTTLLSRVTSISGHASLDSLWIYVDWAFEELGTWKRVDEAGARAMESSSIRTEVKSLLEDMLKESDQLKARDLALRIEHLLEALDPRSEIELPTVAASSLRNV